IAMVAAGEGARHKLDDRLQSVGKNLILVKAGGRTRHGTVADFRPLTNADAEALRQQLGSLLAGRSASQATQRLVSSRYGNRVTMVAGVTPVLQDIRRWDLSRGRFVNSSDMAKQAAVCLIGQTTRKKLFGKGQTPLGQVIRVGGLPFRIIGVLAPKGRLPTGPDQDDQVMVPLSTLQRKLVGQEAVNLILASARSPDLIDRAKEEITRILRERRHIKRGAAA